MNRYREGAVTVHVSVRVDVSELKDWQPAQVATLYVGVAKILAATNQKLNQQYQDEP